jgi:uncharacterized protein
VFSHINGSAMAMRSSSTLNTHHSPLFQEGTRLFNAGEYWHAHEQWEQCWLASQGEEAIFFQALIQAAAALVKWQQGNLRGLQLNWAKSKAKLLLLPSHYAGVDLQGLCLSMERLAADPTTSAPQIVVTL